MSFDLVLQGRSIDDRQVEEFARLCGATDHRRLAAGAARLISADRRADPAAACKAREFDYAFVPGQARLTDFRLVAMDMDSTLITIECIDELADIAGIKPRVAVITRMAMRGEIGFAESLIRRVEMLAGLPETSLERVYDDRLLLSHGAERMLDGLKAGGLTTLLVSGGFSFFTDRLKARLGLDYAYSNRLEIAGGRLTGRVLGPIVDAAGKAAKLREMRKRLALARAQVIAIGDGANDLLMMHEAGVSIAYHAKPVVQESATYSINHVGLDGVLHLFG